MVTRPDVGLAFFSHCLSFLRAASISGLASAAILHSASPYRPVSVKHKITHYGYHVESIWSNKTKQPWRCLKTWSIKVGMYCLKRLQTHHRAVTPFTAGITEVFHYQASFYKENVYCNHWLRQWPRHSATLEQKQTWLFWLQTHSKCRGSFQTQTFF